MCISKADSVRSVGTGLILALGRYRHAFAQEWVVLVWYWGSGLPAASGAPPPPHTATCPHNPIFSRLHLQFNLNPHFMPSRICSKLISPILDLYTSTAPLPPIILWINHTFQIVYTFCPHSDQLDPLFISNWGRVQMRRGPKSGLLPNEGGLASKMQHFTNVFHFIFGKMSNFLISWKKHNDTQMQ